MSLAVSELFRPHHAELRQRLIRCCLVVLLASAVAYLFRDQLAAWCIRPLQQAYPPLEKLVYTKLTDAFLSYLKLSFLVGLMVSFPFILHQAWLFVAPGLHDREKRTVLIVVFWASLLFLGGCLFAFFIVLPWLLHYFMSYAGPSLQPMLKLGLYLTFIARMVLTFGIAFQIPFLMVMAVRTGLVGPDYFRKNRLMFAIVIGVLAFLLSAGDLTATVLLSFPLLGLYESGLVVARVLHRPSR
ncbi:MAG: twin-arginine translocase subunit TatC [Desulfobulbus sp.]|jgi:sec-independent protein translocase protein TatC